MNLYDKWEDTEAALRAIFKLFWYMHENQPPKGSAEEIVWKEELVEIRKWATSIHNRRIEINMKNFACDKKQ